MQRTKTLAIIGPGKVGCALGRRLHGRGFRVVAVAGRTIASARRGARFIGSGRACNAPAAAARMADVVLITTPDRDIASVCRKTSSACGFHRGQSVFHCSGAFGPELLAAAREAGATVGALHPLQSFASAEQAIDRLRGAFFTFQGDVAAAPAARKIVRATGGRLLPIAPKDRELYHAASCVLSNYLVAIADLGLEMMRRSGIDRRAAAKAVLPLMRGTIENLEALGSPDALTGPISRGDFETIRRHMEALRALPAPFVRLYAEMGRYTVQMARRNGLPRAQASRLLKLFRDAPDV